LNVRDADRRHVSAPHRLGGQGGSLSVHRLQAAPNVDEADARPPRYALMAFVLPLLAHAIGNSDAKLAILHIGTNIDCNGVARRRHAMLDRISTSGWTRKLGTSTSEAAELQATLTFSRSPKRTLSMSRSQR
jgi:hypothetical protein